MIKSRDAPGRSLFYLFTKRGNVNNLSPVNGLFNTKIRLTIYDLNI